MSSLPANIPQGAEDGRPIDGDKEPPLLVMRVTDVNCHSHTDNIVRDLHYNVHTLLLTPI